MKLLLNVPLRGVGLAQWKRKYAMEYIICLFLDEFTKKLVNGNMEEPLSYKEYCAEIWYKELQEALLWSLPCVGAME